jgi:hypothetical protein
MESRFGRLETVLVSVQDVYGLRQMYYRLKNRFGHTDGTPRFKSRLEARFSLFGDSANLDAR